MSLITQVFEYSEPYKRKVFGGGGQINSDRLLKSMLLFFAQNELTENVLFAWNEFCGAKDGKAYNLFSTNDLVGTQEYDRGMVLFNGTDQSATVDISGYSTIAIAYRTGDEVIITNSLTGLGEISGNTLYLGSNAAGTEFYGFDLLALVVLNTSAYQLVESYLEMIPLGSKLNYILDEYNGVAAAYSLRKLTKEYKGACIKAYKVTDESTLDIYFKNGVIDEQSLINYSNGDDVFVQTWYDQSGNNIHLEGISTNKPLIVSRGIIQKFNGFPNITFDGYNDYLSVTNIPQFKNIGFASLHSVHRWIQPKTDVRILAQVSIGTARTGRLGIFANSNPAKHYINGRRLDSNSGDSTASVSDIDERITVVSGEFDYQNAKSRIYVNSELEATDSQFQTEGLTSNTNSQIFQIGGDLAANSAFANYFELILFNNTHAEIDEKLMNYYQIGDLIESESIELQSSIEE